MHRVNMLMNLMDPVTIMITGAGAPGAPGIIKSLRINGERKINIIGVDIDDQYSSGMGMVDHFHKIPPPENETVFIGKIMEIARMHQVRVIIPLVTRELFVFSRNMHLFLKNDIQVLVSDYDSLQVANDKYKLMSFCMENNIPVPEFYKVNSYPAFREAAEKLFFPEKMICFKPPVSNGLRGFRIVTPPGKVDKMDLLLNQKPNDVFMGMDEFENIIQQSSYFPELLVMEYLEGDEYSVDVLVDQGTCIEVIPRSRDKIKMGISFAGTLVKHPEIIEYSKKIVTTLGLHGNIGLQFKDDSLGVPKILESNPRVQGTIVFNTAGGFNMVYNAVKMALHEEITKQPIKWNMKMVRYWDEIYYYNGERISI
jgi:carbamoyl-phosphate synthase large subunit